MGGFEIAAKDRCPHRVPRISQNCGCSCAPDGQLKGNIIVSADGKQLQLDNHNSFNERLKNYLGGTNLIALTTPPEIAKGRYEILEALCDILHKRGTSPVKVAGRFGTKQMAQFDAIGIAQ